MRNQIRNSRQTISGKAITTDSNTGHFQLGESQGTIKAKNATRFYGGREISIESYLAIPTFIRQSKVITLG